MVFHRFRAFTRAPKTLHPSERTPCLPLGTRRAFPGTMTGVMTGSRVEPSKIEFLALNYCKKTNNHPYFCRRGHPGSAVFSLFFISILMVYTAHSCWFWGWLTIVLTTLEHLRTICIIRFAGSTSTWWHKPSKAFGFKWNAQVLPMKIGLVSHRSWS